MILTKINNVLAKIQTAIAVAAIFIFFFGVTWLR